MLRIALLLVLLPVFDLALMGHLIGFWNTVFVVLGTGVLGLMLIRYQGINTLRAAQLKVAEGQVPLVEIVTGVFLAIAGFLLLHPGIITDLLALLCLIPGLRNVFTRWFATKAKVQTAGFQHSQSYRQSPSDQSRSRNDDIIEGEFETFDESSDKQGPHSSRLDYHSDHKKK